MFWTAGVLLLIVACSWCTYYSFPSCTPHLTACFGTIPPNELRKWEEMCHQMFPCVCFQTSVLKLRT